jgi:hypothetical protein
VRAEQRFEVAPTTPRRARHFVDATLEEWQCEDVRQEADLLTAEVVADAVRQAPSQVALLVEHTDGVVRVEVSDDPGIVMEPTHEFERRTGRRLLESLARRWGSDADRARTTTWFELLRRR